MVGRWFFMVVGTVFTIPPALVYFLAGFLTMEHRMPPRSVTSSPSRPSSRGCSFRSASCSMCRSRCRARWHCLTASSSTSTWPSITDAPDAVQLDRETVRGQVRYAHASFRYPSAPPVAVLPDAEVEPADVPPEAAEAPPEPFEPPEPFGLEDIDFEMRPGELVALVGPSGSGRLRTTYLLPRLYDVNEGAVEIDGVDVRRIALASLGRIVGVVAQETYLFHASIRDNLRYAKADATKDAELEVAARAAAIHERILELPEGDATIISLV